MSEPRRLLEGGSSFERALLGAAMEDRPSKAAQVAAAAALGIAAPLAGAGAASAASGSATSAAGASSAAGGAVVAGKAAAPFAVKWIALALITSGSAAGVAVLDRAAEPPIAPVIRERPRAIATPTPTPPAPESAPQITPLPDPEPAIDSAPAGTAPQPVKARTVVRRQPRPAPVVEVAAPPLVDNTRRLAREIALVDRARAALAAQDAAGALAALEEHTRDFGNGALGPEALALAIDAHVMAGDRARARGVALVLADRYPDVALTKSYRALIEAEAPTEPAPSR